jgi:hypothetical protein
MIIWKGWGIAVAVIAITAWIGGDLAGEKLLGTPDAFNPLSGLALAAAAAAIWQLSKYLNRQPGRSVVDKATGREFVLRRSHSLFFIPIEYWAWIVAVLAILTFLSAAHGHRLQP